MSVQASVAISPIPQHPSCHCRNPSMRAHSCKHFLCWNVSCVGHSSVSTCSIFLCNRTTNWQKKIEIETAQNKLQLWWNQRNTTTHLLMSSFWISPHRLACDVDIQCHLGPECPRLPWQSRTGLLVKHSFPLLNCRTLDLAGASRTQRNVWMDPLHSHTHTACLPVWLQKRNLTSKLGQGGSCCTLSSAGGRGSVQRTLWLFRSWGGRWNC